MFQQVANFRDLGGYQTRCGQRVRKRRLYRSASLDWMTSEDARFARHELRCLEPLERPVEALSSPVGL